MAYRLIRTEVRRFDRETTDAELANYVRGVVSMQTELVFHKALLDIVDSDTNNQSEGAE